MTAGCQTVSAVTAAAEGLALFAVLDHASDYKNNDSDQNDADDDVSQIILYPKHIKLLLNLS